MRFTVYFSESGLFKEGLSPTISIRQITNAATPIVTNPVTAGVMVEIGDGFYYYDYVASNNDYDYTGLADSITLTEGERYAMCISSVQGDVALIRAMDAGDWDIDDGVSPHRMLFYNEAGTVIKTFELGNALAELPQYKSRTKV